MKNPPSRRSFTEQMMSVLRRRLRVPVTVLMLACNLAWSVPSYGDTTTVINVNLGTRVVQVTGASGTSNLRVGMLMEGVGIPSGTYITQILSDNQILVSHAVPATANDVDATFRDVEAVTATPGGNYTKSGTGLAILMQENLGGGLVQLQGGTLQLGGVTYQGRNVLSGVVADSTQLVFDTTNPTTLNFAPNFTNYLPFERIGSIAGGGGNGVTAINLVGEGSSGALAVGGNNTSTVFNGDIFGDATAILIKEGTGTFTWNNNNEVSMAGLLHVDSGVMAVGGTQGLNDEVRLSLSNKTGTRLELKATNAERISSLSGGGRGAITSFGNGKLGALGGAYINGDGAEVQLSGGQTLTLDNAVVSSFFSFGGSITGNGGFSKIGPNVLELLGNNTYTGDTSVTAGLTDNSNSVMRLGAYGTSSGVGGLSSSGFGSLPSTTRLTLGAGSSGTNRNVVFDLNGATQTLSTLISVNSSGSRSFLLKSGTLNIDTVSGLSSSFNGSFVGYGTVNVLNTLGNEGSDTGWTLSGNSNTTQTGAMNILGGRVTLGRVGGAVGDAVHVTVGSAGTLSVAQTDTIGSLSGNGTVLIDPSRRLVLSAAPAGGIMNSSWSGNITGSGALELAAGASLRLTTEQNYIGGTYLNSGAALYLDYGTGPTSLDLIPGVLNLQGGSVFLSGQGGQTIANTTISNGATTFYTHYDSTSSINLAGNITRSGGGALHVHGNALSVDKANVNGILGGYATHLTLGSNGQPTVSWAVANGTSAVTSLNTFDTDFTLAGGLSGKNMKVTSAPAANSTANPVSGNIGSLYFSDNQALTLTIGGADGTTRTIIESGGILVSPSVGARNSVIAGKISGTEITGGAGGAFGVTDELIVHQYNSRGSLTIDASIVDNGNATRLTKSGPGKLILTRSNSYTGQTSILGGVLELANANSLEFGTLGNSLSDILNHGYLSFDLNLPENVAYEVNNSITGTGTVRKGNDSGGLVILRGSNNTYTGPTQVLAGTLGIENAHTGLGSIAGLTTVSAGATLQLRAVGGSGSPVPETIVLEGGTLSAAVGASTLGGALILTKDSTINTDGPGVPLTLEGTVLAYPGAKLNITTSTVGGTVILTNGLNQFGDISLGDGASLQIGNGSSGAYVGRGTITTGANTSVTTHLNSSLSTGITNDHMNLAAKITGGADFYQVSKTVYLTADNDYTGKTYVGGNGSVGLADLPAELRVGIGGYTGNIGTGDIIIQGSSINGTSTWLRVDLMRNRVWDNRIIINPSTPGSPQSALAGLLRYGLGSLNLSGVIQAGGHNPSTGNVATLQTSSGGKLIVSGTIDNAADREVNFVNDGTIVFSGSGDQTLYGILTANGGVYTFKRDGAITLKGVNAATGNHYIQKGTVIIDNDANAGVGDTTDLYLSHGATLQFNYDERIGALGGMKGSSIILNQGASLTLNDGVTMGINSDISGDGTLLFQQSATSWYGLFGNNSLSSDAFIGAGTNTITVRTNNLTDKGEVSSLGMGSAINLGSSSGIGDSRLEYIGPGQSTDRDINIAGGSGNVVRIAGSGRGALILNGNVTVTTSGNKTLHLHGQTDGNTINGVIDEDGKGALSLIINSAAGNNDMYGQGRWVLSNEFNNFSGNVTVNLGELELAGPLGDGSGTNSVLGDLTKNRVISLGTGNFDGRKFDAFSGGDNLGAASGLGSTGSLIFNDPEDGVATLGSNISFKQEYNSTTNPGWGEIVNNGAKVVVLEGNFTVGDTGARNWVLDGTNAGTTELGVYVPNTIKGNITDTSNTGNVVSLLKEGSGVWRLSGNNTYEGTTTVARGTLELSGGAAIHDNGVINLSNAGSDGSSAEAATLRILTSETIGGLQGAVGSEVEIASGQSLTVRSATQTYNGIIKGAGNLVRTNNDGNARDSTFTNKHTYTGTTTISQTGANAGAPRINVLFLANGGEASGIGASSNAASNLILNAGSTTGGLRWIGTSDQSTDRLFTIGAGSGAAAIWADGSVLGNDVPTIAFTNTGALAFTGTGNRTLTLRGNNRGDNLFAPSINDGGSGVTSLTKADVGTWVVSGNNGFTGKVTISGGTLAITSNTALGTSAGGVEITLAADNSTSYLDLRGVTITGEALTMSGGRNNSFFGLSASEGTNVWTGSIANNVGALYSVGAGASLDLRGVITGTATFTKVGNGTLILSADNTRTGTFAARGGVVALDYSTSNGSKLSDSNTLLLGASVGNGFYRGPNDTNRGQEYLFNGTGVTIDLRGGSHTEIVSGTTLEAGASAIIRSSGSSVLRMNSITRGAGSTLDFGAIEIAQVDNANSNSILGGWATLAKTDWAINSGAGDGLVKALATYGTTWASNVNTNVTGNMSVSGSTNTVRFNNAAASTITATGAATITSGGILVTPNVGANNVAINGSTLTSGTDIIVHQHNTLGSLTIGSQITGGVAVTKSGLGDLYLLGDNNNTGVTYVNEGNLYVGNGGATGQLGSGAGQLVINGSLIFNSTHASTFTQSGNLRGNGDFILAATNTRTINLTADNVNFTGRFIVNGGTLAAGTNGNSLGSSRITTTVNNTGTLELRGLSQGISIFLNDSGTLRGVIGPNNTTGSNISGTLNITGSDTRVEVASGANLTLSNLIYSTTGMNKYGNGILTISANQFQEQVEGSTTAVANPSFKGQLKVMEGEVRLGNVRALGDTGVGNETIISSGASLDLRGNSLNWADDASPTREVFHVSGTGYNNTGALKNSTGLGVVSTIVMDADATLGGGGYSTGGRLVLAPYDINPNTGSNFQGNITRTEAEIYGNNANLTVVGNSTNNDGNGTGVTFRDPKFMTALNSILVKEGVFRIETEADRSQSSFTGLNSSQITNGITVAYGGATFADHTNYSLGLGPNVGSRLNFYRNWNIDHSVGIVMDGITAKANGGANYIDLGVDSATPNPRTYLSGDIVMLGDADRNFFHIDASNGQQTVAEQGNQTGAIATKLIVNGVISGDGGFTKTGYRELRLTNNNTFTGAMNILRFGSAAVPWQDNTVTLNGIDYQTYGDAEGWAEWGVTLSGLNGAVSGTSAINLQRRGLLVLDNTTRLDQTSDLAHVSGSTSDVFGGYNGDRINDAASINFNHGWLKIHGSADVAVQNENLATTGGARVNVLSGTNILDLIPANDANTSMSVTIGEIRRSPGSVLQINALDSTTRFSATNDSLNPTDTVAVYLNNIGTLTQVGGSTAQGTTNKSIIIGLLGGIMPHEYLSDVRQLAYNNGGASDYLNQGRNQQYITAGHFMTYDPATKLLRPLDDSEYFTPSDGLIDTTNGSSGRNVNLLDSYTIVRQNTTINALRFGPLSDTLGNSTTINSTTTLTDLPDGQALQLYVDGTLRISSGMISSANFTTSNTNSLTTLIVGGTLNFGTREAIINNQNALMRTTDGVIATGNLEIRSSIAGSGGLLKTGISQVVLDGANTYSGVTTVSNGNLYLRNGRQSLGVSGPGNGVVIEGNGNLFSDQGIQIGSANAYEDILVKALQGNQSVFRVNQDVTNWFGNLIIDNVDAAGQPLFTPIVRLDNLASTIINGDIYGGSSAVTSDVVAVDSRLLQFEGAGSNNYIFRGQFGDKGDANGSAISIADTISSLPSQAGVRTNENEVLRVNFAGAADTNFILEQQYNAVGRLTLVQGTMLVNYDPNDPLRDGNGFWTDTAISKIPSASSATSFALNGNTSHQGFTMGTTSNGTSSLFLTRDGQSFNMATWSTAGTGLKFVGGINESGTVNFGSSTNTGTLSATGTTGVRLYSADGGTVVFDQVLLGAPGTAPNNFGYTKVGRGTVVLKNSTSTSTANSTLELSGGKLVLDYSTSKNTALLSNSHAAFGGGILEANANANDPSFINFASATNAILQLRLGTTEFVAKGVGDNSMAINLGNAGSTTSTSATLTREVGSVANFVDGGLGILSLNFNAVTTQLTRDTLVPWATYSDVAREADDFATVLTTGTTSVAFTANLTNGSATLSNVSSTAGLTVGMSVTGTNIGTNAVITKIEGSTITLSATSSTTVTNRALTAVMKNKVEAFARAAGDYQNNVTAWTTGQNISETSGGAFTGSLSADRTLSSLRFDSNLNSTVNIDSGRTLLIGNNIAGGLLVSSNTGTANKTITGGFLTAAGSAPELILHQYGKGVLTINSVIKGNISLTIAGPSTTNADTLGTTGVVRLTGNNTYTGVTNVTGAILEVANMNALGPNPASVSNSQLTLNGGTFRWTGETETLGNRGIMLEGNGGVIDVVSPTGNLVVGTNLITTTTSATISSQEQYRGDLIKTGAGALTLINNSNLMGLLDVRQGSLILMKDNDFDTSNSANNAGTTTLLGTSRSVADGTIMRTGTNIQVFLGNANGSGDWGIEEYFTFEGGNTFTYGGFLDTATNLGGSLGGINNLGNRRPLNLNGVLDVKGTTTFNVTSNGILRLNNNAGYLSGSGDIVKDGLGSLHFRGNEAEWKGNLIIKQGAVYAASQADVLGTGYLTGKTITLGDTERQGSAELLINNAESVNGWVYEVNHDIDVVYNPAQTKRLGSENIMNGDTVSYNGDITLNDSLILLIRDTGLSAGGEQSYVNFNGSFKDGSVTSGNLVIQADDNNTGLNDQAANRMYGYAVLNADNSAWTGDITISTNVANGTNSGYNQDVTSILRLGHSKALTAANDVTMNYNSILQAGGQNVTIGNLLTKGGDGQFYGNSGTVSAGGATSLTKSSSEIIENASTTAANLTIAQSTPATYEASWDAFFRDGTLNSQFAAPGANVLQPSAALSLTKAGAGWATLTLDNDYTGTTYVNGGILQVGRNGVGDTGAVTALGTIVNAGGILAGSGTVQGRLSIKSGGILKTGDSAGQAIGTLTVGGDVIFSTGAQAFMQVRAASFNNPGSLMESDPSYDLWLNGIATDAFSSALNDLVTTFQHDMISSMGSILLSGGSKITLESDGYTPKAGDVFTLFRGDSYAGNLNVGNARRYGGETDSTLDLILFALGGNLMWDVSLFNQYGILVVVEGDIPAQTFDPPVITAGPTTNQSETEQLEPGTSVTLTAAATGPTNGGDISYQWLRNGIPVDSPAAKAAVYNFTANYETKGVYTVAATNKGGTTISTTSVTVLVKDLPAITVNPSSITVSPGTSHTFNVSAGGEAPLYYQWFKDDEAVGPATTESSLQLTEISEEDQGVYYVEVSNSAGSATSSSATLTVRDDITDIVVSMNPTETYAGQDIQFTVVHNGDGPFTYEWLRSGVVISGATKSSFILKNAQQTSPETISVRITTANGEFESETLPLVLRPAPPVIITASSSQTVLSGTLLDLKVVATGRPVLKYLWKKDGRALANAVTPDLSKIATLSDGGNYTVDVVNTAGKASIPTDEAIVVVVVDGSSRILPVPLGQTATFTANVSANKKTPLTYLWKRVSITEGIVDPGEDGEEGTADDVIGDIETETPLVPDPLDPTRITGITAKVLKIAKTTEEDMGLYRCTVTGPGLPVTGSEYDLRLYTTAPEFDAGSALVDTVNKTLEFPTGTVGRQYTFELPINRLDITKTPDKVTVSGLPTGLKVDPVSGLITGIPQVTKEGGYKVTVTLSNKYGRVAYSGNLQIDALSETVSGVWVGTVDRNSQIGGNLGGRVDLTISTKASYTGKLTLAGASYSFKGNLDMEGLNPVGTAIIKPSGGSPLTLSFEINPNNNTFRSGSITDGNSTVNFQGWRKIYSKIDTAVTYTGYYTMAIGLDPEVLPIDDQQGSEVAVGDPDLPLGIGYASFTVATDGAVKVAGVLPDGEKISISTFVGPNGEIGIYQYLYRSLKPGGSLHGLMDIDDNGDAPQADPLNSLNTLAGSATWVRPAATKAGARYFAKGFGITGSTYGLPVEVIISGGRYDPPAADMAVLDIDPPEKDEAPVNNSRVEFTHGGDLRYVYYVGNTELVSRNPNADFAVTLNSKILMLDPVSNVSKTTIKATPKTGLVSGVFNTRDYNPRFPEVKPDIVARTVKFQGILINEGGEQVAVGYFMLPQLPANRTDTEPATTTTTSPYFSGRFRFYNTTTETP